MKHNFLQPSRKGDRTLLIAAMSLLVVLIGSMALGVSITPCEKTGTTVVKTLNY